MARTKDMALLPRKVLVAAQGSGLNSVRQYHSAVVPAKAGTHSHRRSCCEGRLPTHFNRGHNAVWVPAFAGTTVEKAFYVAAVVTPPSTTIVCPVMKVEASEARYATAPAISSGSPMRRSGVPAVRRLRLSGSSHSARAKSVLTRPGATQLTRTPFGPHSPARLRHSAKSAALEMP